jgi:hypothetical protein
VKVDVLLVELVVEELLFVVDVHEVRELLLETVVVNVKDIVVDDTVVVDRVVEDVDLVVDVADVVIVLVLLVVVVTVVEVSETVLVPSKVVDEVDVKVVSDEELENVSVEDEMVLVAVLV